jgi:hypothetical protein
MELLSLEPGTVQATSHDIEPADQFKVIAWCDAAIDD